MIFDEITTGLDTISRHEVRKYIEEFTTNKTVIIVSHYMREVEQLCDRIVVLKNSNIVENQKVSQVLDNYDSLDKFYIE